MSSMAAQLRDEAMTPLGMRPGCLAGQSRRGVARHFGTEAKRYPLGSHIYHMISTCDSDGRSSSDHDRGKRDFPWHAARTSAGTLTIRLTGDPTQYPRRY